MYRCIACGHPIDGPSLLTGDTARRLHPDCFAERLPYDAAAALLAVAALFLIPFVRVWSA